MCGIVGILYKDPQYKCSEKKLVEMRDIMSYRGPDDHGIYLENNLGLGHRRLSIIGLGTGHQPLTNEDNSLWIVFNGEIYNYKTLKKSLTSKGHIFNTESDTEVILHLYEEMGDECVNELNGMFAFAIWDSKNKNLFLARDRMGIKPLYYAVTEKAFLFSSEIKSLFKSDCINPECNVEVVPEYFIFRNVAGDQTLFKGVNVLLPGHSMTVTTDNIIKRQYWSPYPEEVHTGIGFEEALEELSFLLQDSVKIRMMSDVPLGTFCSGGLDSSLVTAIAAQQISNQINTFSVGFHESDFDETKYAQIVSSKYNTIHHELKLNNKEFTDFLPKMIWQNDEPLNFSNSIHIYAISKLAKDFVTVVLTGEGADELFAGYPRFQIPNLVEKLQKFPKITLDILSIANLLLRDHRLEKLIYFSGESVDDAILYNSSSIDKKQVRSLIKGNPVNRFSYRRECILKGRSLWNNMSQLSLLDQQTYLVSILYRQDKMSMAASVEARVPFLDYRIVELANSLPYSYKIKNKKRKFILQKVAEPFLPKEIINRRKSGFGVPLAQWFRDDEGLGGVARGVIEESDNGGILNKQVMQNVLKDHRSGRYDHSELLWSMTNFLLWEKAFSIH